MHSSEVMPLVVVQICTISTVVAMYAPTIEKRSKSTHGESIQKKRICPFQRNGLHIAFSRRVFHPRFHCYRRWRTKEILWQADAIIHAVELQRKIAGIHWDGFSIADLPKAREIGIAAVPHFISIVFEQR